MKVLISSLEDQNYDKEVEVSELTYDCGKKHFWMRRVMGDDWFQRVTSTFNFTPQVVRLSDKVFFVVFNQTCDCEEFATWLVYAEDKAREGYKTMRG